MHVGRAQSVPSAVRIRGIPGRSLRTSVIGLNKIVRRFQIHVVVEGKDGNTCKAGGLLECDVDFSRIPSTMVAVQKERRFAHSADGRHPVVCVWWVRGYDRECISTVWTEKTVSGASG